MISEREHAILDKLRILRSTAISHPVAFWRLLDQIDELIEMVGKKADNGGN